MAALASVLIRLYPRAWRRRYGGEMRALLAHEQPSLRTVADLIAGAIDARLNPQSATVAPITEGDHPMSNVYGCNPAGVSRPDQWRSAAWMIGGTIVLALASILLQWQMGKNAFSESLLYAAFPASLMLSSECTYLKRYSGQARTVMSIGGAGMIVLMMWGAVAIANRI